MAKYLWIIAVIGLSGCMKQPQEVKQIFANAQVQYESRSESGMLKKTDMEMPSYFLNLEYQPNQTALTMAQTKQIEAIFKKLLYPEEYRLYVSFGANEDKNIANLTPLLKRAQDIKTKYSHKVKDIKIAYLKNQPLNAVYLRLLS